MYNFLIFCQKIFFFDFYFDIVGENNSKKEDYVKYSKQG